ncbi:MAG: hypothetical protein JST49_03245 [Bacteroidetes bacterium]|nr:hypothetical protein [Bacteroidota bacterium]
MLSSGVLDVAIGLIFIFLLYSLLATTVNESIATIFNLRAKNLRKGIMQLLTNADFEDPTVPKLWLKFYLHPLIKNYGEGTLYTIPSYLPPGNFSAVLYDVLLEKTNEYYSQKVDALGNVVVRPNSDYQAMLKLLDVSIQAATLPNHVDVKPNQNVNLFDRLIQTLLNAPNYLRRSKNYVILKINLFTTVVLIYIGLKKRNVHLGSFKPTDATDYLLPADVAKILRLFFTESYNTAQKNANNPPIQQQPDAQDNAHNALSSEQSTHIETVRLFKEALEKWFDDGMNRVSTWYKRQTQWMIFTIGLTLAVVFNLDTIEITNKLSIDKEARRQLVDMAIAMHDENLQNALETTTTADTLSSFTEKILREDLQKSNNLLAIGYNGFGITNKQFIKDLKQCSYLYEYSRQFDSIQKLQQDTIDQQSLLLVQLSSATDSFINYFNDNEIRKYNMAVEEARLKSTQVDEAKINTSKLIKQDSINRLANKLLKYKYSVDSGIINKDNTKLQAVKTEYNTPAVPIDHTQTKGNGNIRNKKIIVEKRSPEQTWAEINYKLQLIERFSLIKTPLDPQTIHQSYEGLKLVSDSLKARAFYLKVHSPELAYQSTVNKMYTLYNIKIRILYVVYGMIKYHKLIGFILTALAISLGAPFWFDLLNKVMKLRNSVKK